MQVSRLDIDGLLVFEPRVFDDERGAFFESFNLAQFREATGLEVDFVQDNQSISRRNVLRGLHYQTEPHAQGKLVRVARGAVWDVAVDIRPGSPSFGRWAAVELSAANRRQLWIPPGFAHGFCVVSATAQVEYKCTAIYDPEDEIGIAWNDPALDIEWPIATPLLSERDARNPPLDAVLDRLPGY